MTKLDAKLNSFSQVESAIEGNKDAVSDLVKIWYKRIYNFCFRYFNDHDLASEAAQHTFINMYRKVHTLKQAEQFKSWLYRIAFNSCHEEVRRQKRTKIFSVFSLSRTDEDNSEELKGIKQNSGFDPSQQLDRAELGEMLFEMINHLPPDQRVVVIMKEYEGFRFREIAETLDISENTAKSRLYYGLKSLRRELERRNLTLETLLS